MFQAIVTKYHGPGNVRGARVSARAEAGKLTVAWDHRLNVEENHRAAAQALVDRLEWLRPGWTMEGGALPTGGYAFVLIAPKRG